MTLDAVTPDVSVIITAHDAASSIAATLRSVADQERVGWHAYEVILVDDRSTDGTADIARALDLPALHILRLDGFVSSDAPPMTARQTAIDAGVRASRAPLMLLADADSVVPRDWVSGMVRATATGADAVAGPIEFRGSDRSPRWLAAMQTVDACYYLGVCRLVAAAGARSGMMFGNAAVRRSAYERTGGFRRIGFSLTEDLAFARAVRVTGGTLAFPARPVVGVRACESSAELVRRAIRTSTGGWSVLAAWLGIWALLLPALFVLAITAGGRGWWLTFAARYAIGAAFATYCTWRAGRTRLWMFAWVYELAALWIGVRVLVARSRSDHVDWGGIRYARTAPARGRAA